jgi:hypothetical protein
MDIKEHIKGSGLLILILVGLIYLYKNKKTTNDKAN